MVERDRRIELVRMGKIDEFAGSVNEVLTDLDQAFGNLSAKAKLLKEKGADVAGRWEQHFAEQSKAIAVAEAAINKVSNVPLASRSSSPPLVVAPKVEQPAEGKKDEPFRVVSGQAG